MRVQRPTPKWGKPVLLIVGLFLVCGTAGAQVNFRQTVAFGDSLTHNDILPFVYGTHPAWYGADPIEAVFRKGARGGDTLMSYAIAGSDSQDLFLQLFMFYYARYTGRQRRPTVINFEVGGNDIFGNEQLLARRPPGESPEADRVIDDALQRIYQSLLWLWQGNRNARFIVWTVPDVTLTPGHLVTYDDEGRANIRAHLQRINDYIHRLDSVQNFVVVDVYSASREIGLSPPALRGRQLEPGPLHGGQDRLYADRTHPSAAVNAMIANLIIHTLQNRWGARIPYYSMQEVASLAGFR